MGRISTEVLEISRESPKGELWKKKKICYNGMLKEMAGFVGRNVLIWSMSCALPFQIFPVFLSVETGTHNRLKKDDFPCVLCYWEDTGRLGAGVTVWTVCALDPSSNPHGELAKRGAEQSEAILTYLGALRQCLQSHVHRFGFCPFSFHYGFLGWGLFEGGCGSPSLPCEGVFRGPWSGHQAACKGEGSPPSARGVD